MRARGGVMRVTRSPRVPTQDEGFAAKVQARFTKLVPVIEEQLKKAKEGGEDAGGNAAMAEAMLSQMKSWQKARKPSRGAPHEPRSDAYLRRTRRRSRRCAPSCSNSWRKSR